MGAKKKNLSCFFLHSPPTSHPLMSSSRAFGTEWASMFQELKRRILAWGTVIDYGAQSLLGKTVRRRQCFTKEVPIVSMIVHQGSTLGPLRISSQSPSIFVTNIQAVRWGNRGLQLVRIHWWVRSGRQFEVVCGGFIWREVPLGWSPSIGAIGWRWEVEPGWPAGIQHGLRV